ncbi:isochorismate synthase [Dehalobacter restrictus]|uniref:isochorismate synthase n=1 Tax=Dehalobacter restrictus TaxID=55583 RepID=A0A857DK73_9FIRM|nr:isochorismate synthase [Dehalobacter restrictus]QHA00902.1 isochorismate synthase [Dehalobacter restrictus]
MKYLKKEMKLENPLAFWTHFDKQDRLFFYNPLTGELIIGAIRWKTFAEGESYQNYDLVFSARTFFQSVRDPKWAGLGNETIAFKYYYVEKDGKQLLYYPEQAPEEEICGLEDRETKSVRHTYTIADDDYSQWQELFTNVKQEISLKNVDKVVISREVKISCTTTVHIESVLKSLREKNPDSFVFAYAKGGRTFLGATPEILVQKADDEIISYALAGTIPRNAIDEGTQMEILLNDPKNLHEHRIVRDTIADVMKKYCAEVWIDETRILTLKNLYHLKTRLGAKDRSLLTAWVTRLHPTPALGGNPVGPALDIIAREEKHERGMYAAPLGIMDQNGNGIFVAGIRSALIQDNMVYAYTGCGIVEGSDCLEEYIETNDKLRTILEGLVP